MVTTSKLIDQPKKVLIRLNKLPIELADMNKLCRQTNHIIKVVESCKIKIHHFGFLWDDDLVKWAKMIQMVLKLA